MQSPSGFGTNSTNDTANAGNILWKQYFTDKYLLALINTAIHNNWDVQTALQRIQSAQSNVLLSKSALKPFLNVLAAPGIRKYGEYTMDGAGNKNTVIYNGKDVPVHLPDFFVGLQTSWEIDVWGKLKNSKKAAAARLLSSVEGRNMIVTNLVAGIAAAYYELQGLDQTIKVIDETIALQENAVSMVKVQKEAAATTELAVNQFEAQLLHLQSFRQEVLLQISNTENNINFLSGRYPQPIARDTALFANTLAAKIQPGVPAALLQNRADIRQAAFELTAAKADLQSAKAAFYPNFAITAGIGLQAFKPGLLFNGTSIAYNLLGNITAPIINRGAIKASFSRAGAFQLEALYNYQKSIVTGYVETYNELVRLNSLQNQLDLKTREVATLTNAVEASNLLFRTGRANYLEVLVTQQNAIQARIELIAIKKNQQVAGVNMYKALGGGWR